jgi:hypothetical protein
MSALLKYHSSNGRHSLGFLFIRFLLLSVITRVNARQMRGSKVEFDVLDISVRVMYCAVVQVEGAI